ncbi:MAG: hypothetical protein SFX72_17905 [Isosphaeraceae bacterium]|nr:hypothetical protein [Isosphaeraceae bacterium]
MRRFIVPGLALLLLSVAMDASSVEAGQYFVDSFDGPSLSPNLVDVDGTYRLGGGNLRNTGSRNYVRTFAADYILQDFVADLTYSVTTGGGPAGMFFGMGPGTKNSNFFDEPLQAVFFLDYAGDWPFFQGVDVRQWPDAGSQLLAENYYFSSGLINQGGFARARIVKIGDSMTFSADLRFDGVQFRPQFQTTIDLSAQTPYLNATNSRLFFGSGSSPTTFHEFSITAVPEPNALVLALVGLLTTAGRLIVRRSN